MPAECLVRVLRVCMLSFFSSNYRIHVLRNILEGLVQLLPREHDGFVSSHQGMTIEQHPRSQASRIQYYDWLAW